MFELVYVTGVNYLCLWNTPACVLINLFGKNGSFLQIHSGRVTSIVWFTVWQLCQIGRFNAFLSWHRCSKEWVNLKLIEFQAIQAFPISNVMHLSYKSSQIGFSVQRQAEFIFPLSHGHNYLMKNMLPKRIFLDQKIFVNSMMTCNPLLTQGLSLISKVLAERDAKWLIYYLVKQGDPAWNFQQ